MSDLNGKWDFCDQSGEHRCEITLPGDAISALHDAGLIPDPYFGRNEYDLRWIAERDWFATRSFTLDSVACDLVLSGLDTIVEVKVNGQLVLSAQNAFRTYRVDLSKVGQIGENQIELHFRSNVEQAAARQDAQPYFIPYSTDNCPIPSGNMLRKVQCDFGWDWNIALAPFGVLGDIWIAPHTDMRIDGILVDQQHCAGRVDVPITVLINAAQAGTTTYEVTLCGQVATGKLTHLAGAVQATATLTIFDPQLWWPAGQGPQILHDLTVKVGKASDSRRLGLRDIKLVVEEDAAGTGFKFCVNDRDVFAKGANWIPADALSGRITRPGVRDLLQSAIDANMNMLRIWGGGRYEPTWFYDMCDELGLMIWQDFMFACNLYPATDDFLTDVAAEVRENVIRMNHHASIALWCGDNELIGALNWFPESRENRDRYLVGYDRLNRTIETALKAVLPNANWWPSSPSPGYMNFGDAWHDDRSGDMHFWSVWHEGRDFERYRDIKPRFCSEFGFQSYPSMEVIRTFAGPADMNIAAPVLESHQKNKGGNARIAETMFRYFRFPVDFENFVYLSQVQQGLAIKTAITYWRSLKPHCMGSLIWQLNDTWPVASWSSLDYGGGWKLLHHMAREFYQPVLAAIVPRDARYDIRLVSDLADTVEVRVEAFAFDMSGKIRDLDAKNLTLGPACAIDAFSIVFAALKPDEMLGLLWSDGSGGISSDVFAPRPFKTYDLLPPALSMQVTNGVGCQEIAVTSQATALFVAIEADIAGRFSHNAFTVLPGHPVIVKFTPQLSGTVATFAIRDLHSATYGVPK